MSSFLKPKNKKISVIILNFNGGEDLLKTLESVIESDFENLEIVLVDNNSTDNSLILAKQWVMTHCLNEENFPQIHFIENEKNLGFGAGNSVGIKWAFENGADFVFLLNNDALVQKNTILNLWKAIENEKNVGLVSPVIYSDLNYQKVWFCGGKINWWKMRAEHFYCSEQTCLFTTEYVTGCAMLISREVFEKVGLFDDRFFLYYEDTDFSFRVKKAGFKNLVVLNSKVYHAEKSEGNKAGKTYWLVLSALLFFQKHSLGFWKVYFFIYLFFRKVKNFFDTKFLSNEINLAVKRAYLDFQKKEKM